MGNRRRSTSCNKRRVNRDQISEIDRLSSSKNFICKRKNLIFSKFNIVHLKDWSNTFAFICLLLDIGYRSTDVKSKSRDQSFSTHEDYTVHFSSAALFGN